MVYFAFEILHYHGCSSVHNMNSVYLNVCRT